ncbi:MAG: selenide, water dikinase SelD [Polaromonas sp.]|nr:selenide, water dikinase SelD [Polaromonas sp.]
MTSLSRGGCCGCKIAPGVLSGIRKNSSNLPGLNLPAQLLVGIETADDAAVYQLNDEQALIATADFFMPIVDDPYDFGRIAATNAISDVYAMGGTPIMALGIVGMPINVLPLKTIGAILRGGQDVCSDAGIPIAGGHTIDTVEPIYGRVVTGLIRPSRVKKNSGAQLGDVLIPGKPLGVGILSAALKKQALSAEGYAQMIAVTTQLNKPGIELSKMDAVHAMTDVTGFGLLGHGLELARGANLEMQLQLDQIPLLPGVLELAGLGMVTGASGRNWDSHGAEVSLPTHSSPAHQALLSDPQTSGGLLVVCSPEAAQAVLDCFVRHGFNGARQVGSMVQGSGVSVV